MAVANWNACTCSGKSSLVWISNTSLSILDPVLDPELMPEDADDLELVLVREVLLDDLDTSEVMLRERLVLRSLIRLQVFRKAKNQDCNLCNRNHIRHLIVVTDLKSKIYLAVMMMMMVMVIMTLTIDHIAQVVHVRICCWC